MCCLRLFMLCWFLWLGSETHARPSAKTRWLSHVVAVVQKRRDWLFKRDIPSMAKRSGSPAWKHEGLIMTSSRPSLSHHASSVVELSPGVVMAAWFAGTYEGEPDVGIWVSVLNPHKGVWAPPRQVVTPARGPCWNPVLFRHNATGEVLLFYKVGNTPHDWRGFVSRSRDGGATWSAGVPLPPGIQGPSKNKPLELPDGTIVSGTSTEDGPDGQNWSVWVERSTDGGHSWQRIGPIRHCMNSMLQPSVFQDRRGLLKMAMRTRSNAVGMVSGDRTGLHWGPAYLTRLQAPNSGLDAVRLEDGRAVLVYNNSTERGIAGRLSLDLAVSHDGGETWRHGLKLEMARENRRFEFSYPAVIQGAGGDLHITYTWGRYNIKYMRLDPTFL
mmetsp:Transcript_17367/g.41487  ORF Transcript_17367/g.41487 Transcript_17367/m.41487 type:complete len:385 (-) Transcript_17367:423-1577(-)